ncbi:hypothetical protein DFR50_107162 [Roseiarcus fermentans]|uniref:Uncharacterized protein n=1 Tax=Roseiarcus fermentans TaxID=1473586 RepID=A0A366FMM3_9HYPH|nr:hypothetical protein [Roseiarcus fermentans]RBP15892.1 hypothetical protein DFR50_107162 [Roseiarcus fermentans]
MSEAPKNIVTDEDIYANNYHYFYNSLLILSEDSEAQCQVMGFYNVAWEIRDDMLNSGYTVLNTSPLQLSDDQKNCIRRLLERVADIPKSIFNVLNSKDAQLRAMNDPAWVPLREEAKQVISILTAETDRVNAILDIEHS